MATTVTSQWTLYRTWVRKMQTLMSVLEGFDKALNALRRLLAEMFPRLMFWVQPCKGLFARQEFESAGNHLRSAECTVDAEWWAKAVEKAEPYISCL
ncbi:hypothetical protein SRHO_G00273380 [Serrasalmus rhombeus]